jgi:tryptophanyl-tRNA synthetase
MPGLDGQKMSKSYNNTISLRDTAEEVDQKIRTMPTDPARVRRTDPGDPAKCPVWQWHQVYSSDNLQKKVMEGCRSAEIGCLDCKAYIVQSIQEELAPMQERAQAYAESPELVRSIIKEGSEKARDEARRTLDEVNHVLGLDYQ